MTFKRALVVDDSKLARITLRKKLEKRNLQVEMAESGIAALDYLANNTPDIIFMDHLMPEMDGFQTLHQIKANPATEHIPVIMCSGKEFDGYLEEAQAAGASNVLAKPPESGRLDAILADEPPGPVSAAPVAPRAEEPAVQQAAPAAIDKEQILGLLEETLNAHFAQQRDAILTELTRTQASYKDLSTSMDQKLAHQQQTLLNSLEQSQESLREQLIEQFNEGLETQIKEQLAQQAPAQQIVEGPDTDQIADQVEAKLTPLFSERFSAQFSEQGEQWLATVNTQQQQSLEEFSQQVDEQQQALDQRVSELGQALSSKELDVDVKGLTEQLTEATITTVEQSISQLINAAIEDRLPQLTNDISDQVQLQITYQLNQPPEEDGETGATVDKTLTPNAEELRPIISSVLTEQLNQDYEERWQQGLADLRRELQAEDQHDNTPTTSDLETLQKLASQEAQRVVEEALQAAAENGTVADVDSGSSTAQASSIENLWTDVNQRLAEEQALVNSKVKRLSLLFGAGVGVCLLLAVLLSAS